MVVHPSIDRQNKQVIHKYEMKIPEIANKYRVIPQ